MKKGVEPLNQGLEPVHQGPPSGEGSNPSTGIPRLSLSLLQIIEGVRLLRTFPFPLLKKLSEEA